MRHAQKTELFTPVVAGLGHEKTGGAVMLRTAHSAQRTTHNAQRRTQNARRLSAWGLPQWHRGRRSGGSGGMPRCALCSSVHAHDAGLGVVVVVVQPRFARRRQCCAAECLGPSSAVEPCQPPGRLSGASTAAWCVEPIVSGAVGPPAGLEFGPRRQAARWSNWGCLMASGAPANALPGTGAARLGGRGLRPAAPKLGRAGLEREAGAASRWLSRRKNRRRPGRRRPGPPARCPRI